MIKRASICCFIAVGAMALPSTQAATLFIKSDWGGGTDGEYDWTETSGWISATWSDPDWIPSNPPVSTPAWIYPRSFIPPTGDRLLSYVTVENTTNGNLVLNTPNVATSIDSLTLLHSGGAGSTTLKLGGALTVTDTALSTVKLSPSSFKNTTEDPSRLLIDLNGNKFSTGPAGGGILSSRNYTIKDSSASGNGVFEISSLLQGEGVVKVEDNVTIRVLSQNYVQPTGPNNNKLAGHWEFSPTSTLELAFGTGGTTTNYLIYDSPLGNLILGNSTTNTNSVKMMLSTNLASKEARVQGNVTYNAATNGSGSYLELVNGIKFIIAGNFTDKGGTNNAIDYGGGATGGIIFAGGSAAQKEVWIARTALTTNFTVGQAGGNAGNIILKNDLKTVQGAAGTGKFTLMGDSRINLDTFNLTATTVTIGENATLAYTWGNESTSLVHVLGTTAGSLTLNKFKLELNYDGSGWTYGGNLILFQYDAASFTGAPEITELIAPSWLSYDELKWGQIDGSGPNYIYLTNVIPEPSTVGILGIGLASLLWRQRRQIS